MNTAMSGGMKTTRSRRAVMSTDGVCSKCREREENSARLALVWSAAHTAGLESVLVVVLPFVILAGFAFLAFLHFIVSANQIGYPVRCAMS
jgi:hypothetical protein